LSKQTNKYGKSKSKYSLSFTRTCLGDCAEVLKLVPRIATYE